MKKKFQVFVYTILSINFVQAQCDIPEPFEGNTGANMTVFLTEGVIGAFPTNLVEDAYVVAVGDENGLVVGSESIFGVSSTALAVWGDDSAESGIDGAVSNESVSYFLVNGDELYDIEFTAWLMGDGTSYVANGINSAASANVNFNCGPTYCEDGQWYPQHSGITSDNMTILFQGDFITSLNAQVDSAYIVAVTQSGLLVGSSSVYGIEQTSIDVWADDSFTQEVDGAIDNELISFYFVDGNSIYSLTPSFIKSTDQSVVDELSYVTNDIYSVSDADNPTAICVAQLPFGCTDGSAFNYDSNANTDDGSCIAIIEGCTDDAAFNYYSQANTDDGSCIAVVNGCTDETALNFNFQANTDDGSCIAIVNGCTDDSAFNFNEGANTDDGSCLFSNEECDLPQPFYEITGYAMTGLFTADAITALPITSDSAYIVAISPSGLVIGSSSFASADLQNGQTTIAVWGDDIFTEEIDGVLQGEEIIFQLIDGGKLFNLDLTFLIGDEINSAPSPSDESSLILTYESNIVFVVIESIAIESNCEYSSGCNDPNYFEYNSNTECETLIIFGCTDPLALNYNLLATEDDGTCVLSSAGCINPMAINFDPNANLDDGSCLLIGCSDSTYLEYYNQGFIPSINDVQNNELFCQNVAIFGCMDQAACNYSPNVNVDDYSCLYPNDGFDCDNNFVSMSCHPYHESNGYHDNFFGVHPSFSFQNNETIINISQGGINHTFWVVGSGGYSEGDCNVNYVYLPGDLSDIFGSPIMDGARIEVYTDGCLDSLAINYNENADYDFHGSCLFSGCMSEWADNYDELADEDDGSCYREGCTSDWADNYDSLATINNNFCMIQFNQQEYEGILTDDSLLSSLQEQIDNLSYIQSQYNVVLNAYSIIENQLEQCQPGAYGQITLELKEGWNMIGYNLIFASNVAEKISEIESDVELVKDNNGKFYWPGFGYNSIGNFTPGHGYFIKMYNDRDFIFEP